MMHDNRIAPRPAERQRAGYRQFVTDTVHRSGELLSDHAALAVDVFAATPQGVMYAPRSLMARAYFDVHAEEAGMPGFTRESLAAALEELAGRGLLPSWCRPDRTNAEVVAR